MRGGRRRRMCSADVIARAMETGYFRKDDVWEIVFETGALMQGLIMLYLGGRMAMSASRVPRLLPSDRLGGI